MPGTEPLAPKYEISIGAQFLTLELTVNGGQTKLLGRWRLALLVPDVPVATENSFSRFRNCHRRGGTVVERGSRICWSILGTLLGLLLSSFLASPAAAQTQQDEEVKPVPLLTGSAGFITTFDGGEPHLHPIVTPLVLVPIGQRWVIETRATFETDMVQVPGETGFHGGAVDKELEYLQLDFIANQYMTVTVGRFLTPFGIFNERLYPVWIRNLQSDPLILPIGLGPSNASTGAMVRGGFKAHPKFNVNYAVYFSVLSTVNTLDSARFAGGRAGIFVPAARLEIGGSFQHGLQAERSNAFGIHATWQPPALPLDIRTEYERSIAGSGYWLEGAYRLSQVPFHQNEFRRTQIVARMQQYFVGQNFNDALMPANAMLFEAGLNYYFIDGLKASTNYGRQFSTEGNANVWTMALTYRFVVPLGHTGSE
jgi:hypothetical protein